ncbi:polygalacturonase-like [Aristolochia californica]|uniref:polygalacturonase-like n=1 Tax=Aristolochia californica TaxID=171875 RepID=UPI0035DFA5DE
MGAQRYLLLLCTLCCCCYSFFGNSQEVPLFDSHEEATSPDGIVEYSTYFGTIGGVDRGFETHFAAAMGFEPEILSLEGFADAQRPASSYGVVSVNDYGAKGDGSTDDTKAFQKAWAKACSSAPAVLVVPKNKNYLLKQISFSGPCSSNIKVKIDGAIHASSNMNDWDGLNRRHWIIFQKVSGLTVEGSGTINGNGEVWWKNSCKRNKSQPCKIAPTAITFYSCKNLMVKNLRIKDSQQIHVSFERCVNVQASNLKITAPERSPNTDGIHVTSTQNIQITNSVIRTGDDCISIVSGAKNVKATDITCGPGHGISIGSLGSGKSEAHVSQVLVDGANLSGTTNGVRIKTWQGGSGNANDIQFLNIAMNNVSNPIIIDQKYCDSKEPCSEQASAVEVSNVVYKNIKGTSASDVAIKFDCSKSVPCHGIVLQDINLVRIKGKAAKTECKNVNGTAKGQLAPPSCF